MLDFEKIAILSPNGLGSNFSVSHKWIMWPKMPSDHNSRWRRLPFWIWLKRIFYAVNEHIFYQIRYNDAAAILDSDKNLIINRQSLLKFDAP